jgi:NTE family protein
MPTTLDTTRAEAGPEKYLPLARQQRRGNALCLSGGGYRAALFHLGAATRLVELGILSIADSIVSVSGGSIFSAHLASKVADWSDGALADNWSQIAQTFREFTKRNIRTLPLLERWLLPWNWFHPATQARTLAGEYEKYLTSLKLSQLPEHPRFTFCATDMSFGVNWISSASARAIIRQAI